MRIKRRQRAEESAHKIGVKLIFPIFFLIMPSVFLVTPGPAIIMLTENFSRMIADMQGGRHGPSIVQMLVAPRI
jgi:tight adherence protein C